MREGITLCRMAKGLSERLDTLIVGPVVVHLPRKEGVLFAAEYASHERTVFEGKELVFRRRK